MGQEEREAEAMRMSEGEIEGSRVVGGQSGQVVKTAVAHRKAAAEAGKKAAMERLAIVKSKQGTEGQHRLDRAAELTLGSGTGNNEAGGDGVMAAVEADQIRAQLTAGASVQQQHSAGSAGH